MTERYPNGLEQEFTRTKVEYNLFRQITILFKRLLIVDLIPYILRVLLSKLIVLLNKGLIPRKGYIGALIK